MGPPAAQNASFISILALVKGSGDAAALYDLRPRAGVASTARTTGATGLVKSNTYLSGSVMEISNPTEPRDRGAAE